MFGHTAQNGGVYGGFDIYLLIFFPKSAVVTHVRAV